VLRRQTKVHVSRFAQNESQFAVNPACEVIFFVHRKKCLWKTLVTNQVQRLHQHGASQALAAVFWNDADVIHFARVKVGMRVDKNETNIVSRDFESQPESWDEFAAGPMHGQCVLARQGVVELRTIETSGEGRLDQPHKLFVIGWDVRETFPGDTEERWKAFIDSPDEQLQARQAGKSIPRECVPPGEIVVLKKGLTDGDSGGV